MTNVLIAGGTGTLGARIARHLLADQTVQLRLLLRAGALDKPEKARTVAGLVALGATVATGDLKDPASLTEATRGIDVVVSAVQGGADVMIDGQLALARAASANGARRFVPSDFALDIFNAPAGAPMFDMRRRAGEAIEATGIDVVRVLNGAFMDMMLDPDTADVVDLQKGTAQYFGTGDEPFDLTTVEDVARFTARLAVDFSAPAGVYAISGERTTFNGVADAAERVTGRTLARRSLGTVQDLRDATAGMANPWAAVREWYLLSMLTTPPFAAVENSRYADLRPVGLDEYFSSQQKKAATDA